MKKLSVFLVLLVAACGSNSNHSTPDATTTPPPDAGEPPCFMGVPQTHNDLINACVDSTVTRIVKYQDLPTELIALPLLNKDGSLPPLP